MEEIRGIVRNIAIVILLASFLELLLPNSSMRRFIQLVMGLFVLMAILAPVAALLERPLAFEIPAWTQTQSNDVSQELVQVFEQGNSLREKGQQTALEGYKKVVERQAKALALTVRGVERVSVGVSAKPTGVIEQLQVQIGIEDSAIPPIKPVTEPDKQVEVSKSNSPEEKRISRELQNRLGALLGIPEDKILVRFSGPGMK